MTSPPLILTLLSLPKEQKQQQLIERSTGKFPPYLPYVLPSMTTNSTPSTLLYHEDRPDIVFHRCWRLQDCTSCLEAEDACAWCPVVSSPHSFSPLHFSTPGIQSFTLSFSLCSYLRIYLLIWVPVLYMCPQPLSSSPPSDPHTRFQRGCLSTLERAIRTQGAGIEMSC